MPKRTNSDAAQPFGRIATKFRRALRNGTGCSLNHDEVIEVFRSPIYAMIAEREAQELIEMYAPSGREPLGPDKTR